MRIIGTTLKIWLNLFADQFFLERYSDRDLKSSQTIEGLISDRFNAVFDVSTS